MAQLTNGSITLAPYSSSVLFKNSLIVNKAPKANAGANQTITLPTNSLTLSGSGTDSDGTVTDYLWTKISGPSNSNITNSNSPVTNITELTEGVYEFELQVTDNKGAAAKDTVTITVNPAEKHTPECKCRTRPNVPASGKQSNTYRKRLGH